jgi:hypothetical protein
VSIQHIDISGEDIQNIPASLSSFLLDGGEGGVARGSFAGVVAASEGVADGVTAPPSAVCVWL